MNFLEKSATWQTMWYNGSMDRLPRRLLFLRERAGLTQGQLARLAGIDQGNLSRLERSISIRVSAQLVAQLARALNTTTDYLLNLTDDPIRPEQGNQVDPDVALLLHELGELGEKDVATVAAIVKCLRRLGDKLEKE